MANGDEYPFQRLIEETHALVDADRKARGLKPWDWSRRKAKHEDDQAFAYRLRALISGLWKL